MLEWITIVTLVVSGLLLASLLALISVAAGYHVAQVRCLRGYCPAGDLDDEPEARPPADFLIRSNPIQ
jgi:hypothetical protein